MSTELKLDFSSIPAAWSGYPVHYKVMNQALEKIADGSLKLKSGDKNVSLSFDSNEALQAGLYVFALKLPSGKVLTKPFHFENGAASMIVVPYETSSADWLDSQTFLGHALNKKDEFLAMEKLVTSGKVKLTEDPVFSAAEVKLSSFYPQYSDRSILLYKSDMLVEPISGTLHRIYKISGHNFESSSIAELQVGKTFALIALPPLSRRDENEDLTIDCVWNDVYDSVNDISVSVNLQNKAAQSLLSYMKLGDIDSAQSVSQPVIAQAHKMFQEKLQDVGAACVAAYLLISTSAWKHLPLNWCQNISDFFPHIADGAIINAHRRIVDLNESVTPVDLERIGELLLLATSRGIPIFSAGLRLLNDDLIALRNSMIELNSKSESVKRIDTALKRTNMYLNYCDFKNSFTTFIFEKAEERKKVFTYQ